MQRVFLLRDSREIYGTYYNIDNAYNSLLQFIYTYYKYHTINSITSCDINHMVRSFQIVEYENNLIHNTYIMENNFCLYKNIFVKKYQLLI